VNLLDACLQLLNPVRCFSDCRIGNAVVALNFVRQNPHRRNKGCGRRSTQALINVFHHEYLSWVNTNKKWGSTGWKPIPLCNQFEEIRFHFANEIRRRYLVPELAKKLHC
jgi:hypothetical protein